MKDVKGVARAGNVYWAATSGGLFGWTEGSQDFQLFTSAEGLQSIDLTAVSVDAYGNVWTGSSTGFIQVYSPSTGTIRTILDIASASQTNKQINSFTMYGDTVLICTEFGLSLFRIGKFEFGDTYTKFGTVPSTTHVSVSGAAIYNGYIWASITDGLTNNWIAAGSLNNPNLLPPEAWTLQLVGGASVIPRSLAVFNNRLYAGTSSGLYFLNGSTWSSVDALAGQNVVALMTGGDSLTAGTTDNEILRIAPSNAAVFYGTILPSILTSLATDAAGRPVAGTLSGGIQMYGTTWASHFPNGPNANQFANVAVDADGIVWAGSGPASGQGFYRYNGLQWKSFTRANSALAANEVYRMSVGCNGSVWASTWGRGVVEIPKGFDRVDSSHVFGTNVGMVGVTGDPSFVVVSNVVCDGQGNQWMSVLGSADKNVLTVRRSNGAWKSIPAIISGVKLTLLTENAVDKTLAVDAFDNLWSVVRDAAFRGVISFGNRGTIDSTAAIFVSSSNGLPSDEIKTIVVDQDNDLWVGTDKGIAIILDTQNPFRTGGIAAYKPLAGLVINTIAVDPLNQKWVGTTEGAILLSPDGTQQLASYTVENTGGKLIDNDIKSIAVDGTTGTVYFGTAFGLASLTTAAAAPKTAFDNIVIYPNPYRVPSPTPVTIDGLVQNSSIKILTIDGRLVRDVKTPGGRIGFWDGKDTNGNDVASGIYIVVGYSEDGSSVANGKIAVLRK